MVMNGNEAQGFLDFIVHRVLVKLTTDSWWTVLFHSFQSV